MKQLGPFRGTWDGPVVFPRRLVSGRLVPGRLVPERLVSGRLVPGRLRALLRRAIRAVTVPVAAWTVMTVRVLSLVLLSAPPSWG